MNFLAVDAANANGFVVHILALDGEVATIARRARPMKWGASLMLARSILAVSVVGMLSAAGLQAQALTAAAELSFANGVSSYRSGEAIRLIITYRSAESDCYLVSDTIPSRMDHIELTPVSGIFRWQEGDGPGSDASMWSKLDAGKSAASTVTLNDLFRFDEAGDYTVQVRTRHLHCGQYPSAESTELVTNAVRFHVEPFAAADEQQLAQSLEREIRSAIDQPAAERLARELDYLPGDDATRAKIALTLHPKLFYPFGIYVSKGLWIARNRSLIISAMQASISDPSIYFGANLIQTLVDLQTEPSSPNVNCCVLSGKVDPQKVALTAEYTHQLAQSMSSRSGNNLVDTALTVFSLDTRAKSKQPEASVDAQAAREVLISNFAEINEYQVGTLLQQFGPELADPRIHPALETLKTESKGIFSGNRSAALEEIQRITSGASAQH